MPKIKNANPTNVQLEVKNFGPVEKAEIELRPLTVFVGESNTGKTYLSTLIYALHRRFEGFARFPWSHDAVSELRLIMRDSQIHQDKEISEALNSLRTSRLPFKFSDLPQGMRDSLQASLKDDEVFSSQLKRCFGLQSVSELVRFTGSPCNQMKISLKISDNNQSLWSVDMQTSESGATVSASTHGELVICSEAAEGSQETLNVKDLETLLRSHNQKTAKAYYLPATRRGIMQNYERVAKSFIERPIRSSTEDFAEISLSSEMETELLTQISRYKEGNGSSDQLPYIAKALEDDVLRGK